jgi:hypothetical protein
VFDLSSLELSRTIWNLKDYQVSDGDTLSAEDLLELKDFFDNKKNSVFRLTKDASHYAFPTEQIVYKGYEPSKKRFITRNSYLCHYYWTSGAVPGVTNGYINIFPNNCRPTINGMFLNYLLSPTESPFKDAMRDLWIIRSKDEATKGFPMGILWADIRTTNALLLTNLLITTRLCTGWSLDLVWHRLLQMGFSKPVALILSTLFEFNKQTVTGSSSFGPHFVAAELSKKLNLTNNGPHTTDQPIGRSDSDTGASSYQKFSPKKFINGDYNVDPNEVNTLTEGVGLTKTNHLWFGEKAVLETEIIDDDDDFMEDCGDPDCDECSANRHRREALKAKPTSKTDKWKLWDQIMGEIDVDPGIVKELEERMQNDIPTNFKRKTFE